MEIVGADTELQHFLDHWQEVRQRANRTQWWRIGPPNQPASCRQDKRVFDDSERDAALEELSRERTVGTANRSDRSRRFAIRLLDTSNIFFQTDAVAHGAILNLAGRAVTGP